MTRPRVVADTNVISYIYKKHSLGEVYRAHLELADVAISFQTGAELEVWALRANWGEKKRAEFALFVAPYVVIPHTPPLSELYAQVRYQSLSAGRPIDPADAWIAATALALRCPLVTHNAADYAGVSGLSVISENKS